MQGLPPNRTRLNLEATHSMAKYLEQIGDLAVGRGISKSSLTPAQRRNINPQNPTFFGVEQRDAVPYQRIVQNADNIKAVMDGFSQINETSAGAIPTSAANVVADTLKQRWIIQEAFDTPKRGSIYSGMEKNPVVNLYEINKRHKRDQLYSLQ